MPPFFLSGIYQIFRSRKFLANSGISAQVGECGPCTPLQAERLRQVKGCRAPDRPGARVGHGGIALGTRSEFNAGEHTV